MAFKIANKGENTMAKFTMPAYDRTTLPNCAAALIMVLVLVLMFVPFWNLGTPEKPVSASICSYIWFPKDNIKLTTAIKNEVKAVDLAERQEAAVKAGGSADDVKALSKSKLNNIAAINSVAVEPLLMMLTGFVGAILCFLKADKRLPSLLPIIFGVVGILGFGFSKVLTLGDFSGLMLGLSIAAAVCGVASIVVLTLDK